MLNPDADIFLLALDGSLTATERRLPASKPAATSIVHGVPLVTRDRRIWRSKLVPLARAAK